MIIANAIFKLINLLCTHVSVKSTDTGSSYNKGNLHCCIIWNYAWLEFTSSFDLDYLKNCFYKMYEIYKEVLKFFWASIQSKYKTKIYFAVTFIALKQLNDDLRQGAG